MKGYLTSIILKQDNGTQKSKFDHDITKLCANITSLKNSGKNIVCPSKIFFWYLLCDTIQLAIWILSQAIS